MSEPPPADAATETAAAVVLVPVTTTVAGSAGLRTFRRPDGTRVGIAFTDHGTLDRVLGPGQARIALHPRALRSMLARVGVYAVQLDPHQVVATAHPTHRRAS